LLRPILSNQGYHDTRGLRSAREGSAIRLLGIVLMRQRPGTTKGIVFIMLEDEFGAANLVINLNIGDRDRAAMIGARLIVAEGRVERETEHAEVPITHLICRKLIDRGDLLRQLSLSDNDPIWADATLGRADEVRRPNLRSARVKAGLPASQTFGTRPSFYEQRRRRVVSTSAILAASSRRSGVPSRSSDDKCRTGTARHSRKHEAQDLSNRIAGRNR
jgi:error-prone DNA polymerase